MILNILFLATAAFADIMDDFDSLGGNATLIERAQALNPEKTVEIVENRVVKRDKRFEFSPEYASIVSGDSYLKTQIAGMNIHYHFSPKWGVSLKYNSMFNRLSGEALNLINDTRMISDGITPEIIYPKSQLLGLIQYAPIYGKLNFFNRATVQFDVYALAGAGDIELSNGKTSTWSTGGGIGFWLSQHLSTRLEMRYQKYSAQGVSREIPMDLTVAGLQVGYLL